MVFTLDLSTLISILRWKCSAKRLANEPVTGKPPRVRLVGISEGQRFLATFTAFQRFILGPRAACLTLLIFLLTKYSLISLFKFLIRGAVTVVFLDFRSLFLLFILFFIVPGMGSQLFSLST